MIIGIAGFIGSGKDTVADYLTNIHHYRRDSFANTLKDAVSIVFGWDRVLLEGKTQESREWREQVDEWWANRLKIPHLTPRWVLQNWGTDVLRQGFHDDIWIASLENKLRHTKDNVVISDVRFPNEVNAIRKSGGKVIRIKRGPEPEWYNMAGALNVYGNLDDDKADYVREQLQTMGVHQSEYSLVGFSFDHVIDNSLPGLDNLFHQIDSIL